LDQPGPVAFAHRGGAAHHPENSWPAFEHAVSLGYQYLETDLHATADGVLVAFHDHTLNRATDRAGRIARLPHREVTAARIDGREPIPMMEDLLAAWPDIRFNIDVKEDQAIGPLARALARVNAWERVCVCSFSSRRLRVTRRALGRPVCMALSPAALATVRLSRDLARRLASEGMRCAQIPAAFASRGFVRRAHALGLQVHVWTVNDRTEMTCLLDLGADGIMTDQTVLLRDVLAGRGQWDTVPQHTVGEKLPAVKNPR
ncbi:MAG: glycerophosphodiester phosphodiesterase family protein, partial [Streptosporangiaceae bacterium]